MRTSKVGDSLAMRRERGIWGTASPAGRWHASRDPSANEQDGDGRSIEGSLGDAAKHKPFDATHAASADARRKASSRTCVRTG